MTYKQIPVLTAALILTACQATSPTSGQFAARDRDGSASSFCQDRYFSASASQHSRLRAARHCDTQSRVAERIRRIEGRDKNLPFDPNESR